MSEFVSGVAISLAAAIVDHFLTNPLSDKIRSALDKRELSKHLSEVIEIEITKIQKEYPFIDIDGLSETICEDNATSLIAMSLDIEGTTIEAFNSKAAFKAHADTQEMKQAVQSFIQKLAGVIQDHYRNRITPEDRVFLIDLVNCVTKVIDQRLINESAKKAPVPCVIAPELPTHYIPRYVQAIDSTQSLKGNPLVETLQTDKHIVLLDSAGAGKTIAALECYYQAINEGFTPFWIPLHLYAGIDISDSNDESYAFKYLLNNAQPNQVFILDGFDELRCDLVAEFVQLLNSKASALANTMIVVTSRWNFYNTHGRSNGRLTSFKPYELSSITQENINAYLEARGIIAEEFWYAVQNARLNDLVIIPFYLENICDIFQKDNVLPEQLNIMDSIVDYRYTKDIEKFEFTHPLYVRKEYLYRQLMKVAITMQLMQSYTISNDDYQSIVIDSNDQQLLRCAGIWQQLANDNWSFAHNNLREYLSAKYLCRLENIIDITKKIADMHPETGHYSIKPSWINVVSYLLIIYPDESLFDWILKNAPGDLALFDSNRLTIEQCDNALYHVFSYCNKNNYYLEWDQQEKCAALVKSAKSLQCIHHQIEVADSIFGKQNAIRVLWKLPSLQWERENTKAVLLKVLQSDPSIEIKREAMHVLAKHHLCSSNDASAIISQFENCHDPNTLDAILRILVSQHHPSDYIDYYISLLPYLHTAHTINTSFWHNIEVALLSADNHESLTKVLTALVDMDMAHLTRKENGLFGKLCDKCVNLYSVDSRIKQYLFNYVVNPKVHYYHSVWSEISSFALRTGTASEFLALCINSSHTYMLASSMDEELMSVFINNIHAGIFSVEQGHEMLNHLNWESKEYHVLDEELLLQTGEHYISQAQKLHNARRTKQQTETQRFFDSLFDSELYNILVQEVLSSNIEEFSITGLWDAGIENYDARYLCFCYLNTIIDDIDRDKLNNWMSYVDFQWFALNKITQMLSSKSEEQPVISKDQRDKIAAFADEFLYRNRIEAHFENNTASINAQLQLVLLAVVRLNIPCTNDQYHLMMRIPRFFLDESTSDTLSPYIFNHLSLDEIKNEFFLMKSTGELSEPLRPMFFAFCNEYRITLDDIRDYAAITIQTDEYPYEAIRYLNEYYGKEYLLEEVVLQCQSIEKALSVINYIGYVAPSTRLDDFLWSGFLQSTNPSVLVKLISRNHMPSIHYLLSESKNLGHIPGVLSTDNAFSEYTEALSQVSNSVLLSTLFDFLKMSTGDNFIDGEFGVGAFSCFRISFMFAVICSYLTKTHFCKQYNTSLT